MKIQRPLKRFNTKVPPKRRYRWFLCLLAIISIGQAQDSTDSEAAYLNFSGSVNLNTNGISPVPAFSLDKPSVIGALSLGRKRLSFTPEMAFSTEGKPWFISPRFTYKLIDQQKFDFYISSMYNFTYSYLEELINGSLQTSTKVEHYALLQSASTYMLSKKTSISLITFHGFGLKNASIHRGNFFILGANIIKLRITENVYHSLFPQLVYVNMDGDTDGLFASGILGVGHKKWPFFLSTQLTQPLATNISPDPGFNWNVGLTYNF